MFRKLSIVLVLFVFTTSAFATSTKSSIQVKGSDTMVNLGQAWAEAFNKIHPDVNIAVTGGGSGTGIAALINGTCDVAECSRAMAPKEIKQAEARGIEPNQEIVGLDGIAVTEHHDKRYGMQAKEIAEQYFDSVLIIPGREVDEGINQVVELFLPNGSMFRFVAHPRYLGSLKIDARVQGIEVKNALHAGEINEEKVRELAKQHNLMLMTNSDAHYLSDIGQFYNEVALEDLYARAQPITKDWTL